MVEEGEEKEKDQVGGSVSWGSRRAREDPWGLVDMPELGCGGQMMAGGPEPLKETCSLLGPPGQRSGRTDSL